METKYGKPWTEWRDVREDIDALLAGEAPHYASTCPTCIRVALMGFEIVDSSHGALSQEADDLADAAGKL